MGYDIYDTVLFATAIIATGAVAGLFAGLFGIGGGVVIVPVLDEIFIALSFSEHSMHLAIATSLATIIPTSIASTKAHIKKGSFDRSIFKSWAPFLFIGSLLGGFVAGYIEKHILSLLFGVINMIVAISFFSPKTLIISSHLPKNVFINKSMPTVIGAICSWLGIGGGSLTVPTLNLFSHPIHKAIGTASAFGLCIAIPASIGYIYSGWGVELRPAFSLGYIHTVSFILIISSSVFFAPVGAKIAHNLDEKKLKKIFGVFLIVVSTKMILQSFGVSLF